MKTRTILSALVVSTLGFATLAQAQNDWQQRERREQRQLRDQEREEQRRWRVEQQRQLERQQRELEQRQLGATRFMPQSQPQQLQTIDTRTQRLPPPPHGHEWQTAGNGDFMLINQSNGMMVQLVRNVTPQNGSPQ